MFFFRRTPAPPQPDPNTLYNLLLALIQKDKDMLALLQSIRADVDALKAELSNQATAIQANAAAKAELDVSFPVAQALQAEVADLKAQFAAATN